MTFQIETKGRYDFIKLTEQVAEVVKESKVTDGAVLVFCAHSTVAVTIMEWEDGIKQDIKKAFEAWIPEDADYEHHKRWHDHNGAAHIKSAIIGPCLTVLVENNELTLGQWQEIVLIDFDEKPRTRNLIIKIMPA